MRYAEALVLDQKPELALDICAKGLKKVSSENVQYLVRLYFTQAARTVVTDYLRYWKENTIC